MLRALPGGRTSETLSTPIDKLALLETLQRKALWLSTWMIHNANHLRPSRDGLKVGGHQASSASLSTILTALYLDVLRPQDRLAVKPHASPMFHALQYLLGQQTREKMERFRALGGAQAYPSRNKDGDIVDFSTGSVGLGVGITLFASLVQDYLRAHRLISSETPPGRMIALVGDAELDEGNIYEALLEGWKHDVRNLWWVIDYNRQSLDAVVSDRLFGRIDALFEMFGWRVVTLKYGRLLQAAFSRPDGEQLRDWIDACPNSLYSALVYKGGEGWREQLRRDLNRYPGIRAILEEHDDEALGALMTNLAGHDMGSVLDAFNAVTDDQPTCFIAYTIKGYGLPFAGHKDNHAGLMNPEQMALFQQRMGVPAGAEWEPFAGLERSPEELTEFLASRPLAGTRKHESAPVPVPELLPAPRGERLSTQEAFGRLLGSLATGDTPLSSRIVTTSPDVTVSTNLGAWVNRRGIFDRTERADIFREQKVVSAQRWAMTPQGQHLELGIAEHNLFLQLGAFGLAGPLFGARLLPIGTIYDPFIKRGLDALNYALYQDARFILVATPSGVTLAPEGGAHQSVVEPLVGLGQPGLLAYEPAYADELAILLRWAFAEIQEEDGESVYFRLSTRPLPQPPRTLDKAASQAIIDGAYWLREPAPGATLAIAYCGAVAPEALAAWETLADDVPGVGLLAITSPGSLHRDWRASLAVGTDCAVARLLSRLAPGAALVTVADSHPATLSWLGAVSHNSIVPLGIDHFGQSGDIPDLYRVYGLDADAIIDAAARACLRVARA
ncbi:MAG: transketolase [Alphaproteobacteria bacterium]|nr:transketolase [Alphaproteobacteria bacterium]